MGSVRGAIDRPLSVAITVADPASVAGAAFALQYSSSLSVAVDSAFFDVFYNQFEPLDATGIPLADGSGWKFPLHDEDGSPVTDIDGNPVYVPDRTRVDGVVYTQSVIDNVTRQSATVHHQISGARIHPAAAGENRPLFHLQVSLKAGRPAGKYTIAIVPATVNNADAGYDPAGETVDLLIGSEADGASFPVIIDDRDYAARVVSGYVEFRTDMEGEQEIIADADKPPSDGIAAADAGGGGGGGGSCFIGTMISGSSKGADGAAPDGSPIRNESLRSASRAPQEILLQTKPGIDKAAIKMLHRGLGLGGETVRRMAGSGIHRVRLGKGVDIDSAIKRYRDSGLVAEAEPNVVRYPQGGIFPNDGFYPGQWAMDTDDVRMAWSIRRSDRPVVVAVIDTGIDYTHPDLRESIWVNDAEKNGRTGIDDDGNGYVDDLFGWDFADNDADPMDSDGHGTHVAGIIGAAGNNGIGVAGICWNVRLMPLKVMGDRTGAMYGSDILEAIEYARKKGAVVLNCSFGGPSYSNIEYSFLKSLQQNDGLVVCAAGNAGVDIDLPGNATYPASYNLDNILSVAASNPDGSMAYFSNYGRVSVDLMAPGLDMLSTIPAKTAAARAEVVQTATGSVYAAAAMTFAGTTGAEGVAGSLYDCGYGYPEEIPDAVRGNIALVRRGSPGGDAFAISEKVANVQAKGGIGAVISNDAAGAFNASLGSPGGWVPVVAVSEAEGQALRQSAPEGVRLVNSLTDDKNFYGRMSGTSMAAPYVSGLVALMRARQPASGYAVIKSAVLDHAVYAPSAAGRTASDGRVNLYDALGAMLTPGDITGDDRVALDDLIVNLHILSGIQPSGPIVFHPEKSDVNGDGRIGLEEGIHILNRVAR